MTQHKVQGYGWKRDLPDHRDHLYHEHNTVEQAVNLPPLVDLAPSMPSIYDQLQLGSCTGNGWARVMQYMARKQSGQFSQFGVPSRLFIYYNERLIEGTVDQDAGAQIRTGAQVVAQFGAPPETDWAYDIARFAEKPPVRAFNDAKKLEALKYQRVVVGAPGAPMRSALAKDLPIVFGFAVPDYFESGWDYSTPLPLPGATTQIIGGHCVVISGYDFSCKRFPAPAFQCDNSWGPDWGLDGRFWMDYRWFDPSPGLASDLWIVQQVS